MALQGRAARHPTQDCGSGAGLVLRCPRSHFCTTTCVCKPRLYACHAPTVTHRARPTIRAVVDGGASSASFGVPSPEASATSAEGGVSSSAILGTALLGSAMKPSREGPPPAPPAVLLFRPSAPIAPPTRVRDVPRIRRPRDVKLMLNPPGFAPVEAPGSLEATSRHVTLAPLLSPAPPPKVDAHTHAHTCTHTYTARTAWLTASRSVEWRRP